jgi:hypothetical protein
MPVFIYHAPATDRAILYVSKISLMGHSASSLTGNQKPGEGQPGIESNKLNCRATCMGTALRTCTGLVSLSEIEHFPGERLLSRACLSPGL